MTDTTDLPRFADWLSEYCEKNEHPFVRDSWKMVSCCFELDQHLPPRYGWRFSDEEAIKQQVASAKDAAEVNRVYWLDQARNIEAYAVMTLWRGVELLAPAVECLNARKVVPSAVLARSLLELATASIMNANDIGLMMTSLEFTGKNAVVSSEFEARVVKMIWGSRLGEQPTHLKQTNILTLLQRASKNPNAKELLPTYEYLCEVAHPNFVGNVRFWSHVESTGSDGSELRVLSRGADHDSALHIVDKIVWSLGWSAVCIRNAFEIIRTALSDLFSKLGLHGPDMGQGTVQ